MNPLGTTTGSFYALQLENPQFSGGSCTANLNLFRTLSGQVTMLTTTVVACYDGMTLRTAVRSGFLFVFMDSPSRTLLYVADQTIPSGQPGVGAYAIPAGCGISKVELMYADTVAPAQLARPSVAAFDTSVDMQWAGSGDNANGSGRYIYQVWRRDLPNGTWAGLANTLTPGFTDRTVSPATSYEYSVVTYDYHLNASPNQIVQVTTAPAGSRDPRQIGLHPTGSYWGGAGEQIDMQSGNVNFTLPLLDVKGRGGVGTKLALNYNSQNWRKDSGGTWNYGQDVGFGYGWRLLAGSITPVWKGMWDLDHFIYTDSTGAEYRLDIGQTGVWTSHEGLHLSYDVARRKLYFDDGTFWYMEAESAENEHDAGTLYPTIMQDTNGNQIRIQYRAGAGSAFGDSSARPDKILDARSRAIGQLSEMATWRFQYSPDEYLTSIYNPINNTSITPSYTPAAVAISSPWGTATSVNAKLLVGLTRGGSTYLFNYYAGVGSSAGEMEWVKLPFGGRIRWVYRDFTYVGGRTLREVSARYLQVPTPDNPNPAETAHTMWHNDAVDAGSSYHSGSAVYDALGQRGWTFDPDGKATVFNQLTGAGVVKRHTVYEWTYVNPANKVFPYVKKASTWEYGPGGPGGSSIVTVSEQTLDAFGNVKQTKQRNGDPGTTERVTNYTYAHEGPNVNNYLGRYIRNRLTGVTVSGTGQATPIPVFSATYDGANITSLNVPANLPLYDAANYPAGMPWRGNATSITQGNTTTAVSLIDMTGMVRTSTGPNGTMTVTPDPGTYLATAGSVQLNGVQTTLSYDGMLRLTTATGPDGPATFGWDELDRQTYQSLPGGMGVGTVYSFNPPMRTEIRGVRWTRHWLDGLGRPVKTETGYNKAAVPPATQAQAIVESVVETEYAPCACGPFGKPVRTTRPRAASDGVKAWSVTTYDELGRVVRVQHAPLTGATGSSGETLYVYNIASPGAGIPLRAMVQVTDPGGRWKKTFTDEFGQITEVVEPRPGGGEYLTSYTYNVLGSMVMVTMPRDGTTQTRSFEYYPNGTLKATTYPETGRTEYTWGNGRLQSKKDKDGRVINYVLDGNARLARIERLTLGAGAVKTEDVTQQTRYYYDAAGRTQKIEYGGTPGNPARAEVLTYTAAGQVQTKTFQHPWGSLTASWTYDMVGQLDVATYPSGQKHWYKYDETGRNNSVVDPSQAGTPQRYSAVYDWAGRMTQMSALQFTPSGAGDSGWSQSWSYNALGQMSGYGLGKDGHGVGVTYDYGSVPAAGKLASATTNDNGVNSTVSYAYDSLGRLQSAVAGNWSQTFNYDGFGNLLTAPGTGEATQIVSGGSGGGVLDVDQHLRQSGTEVYEYDAAGLRVTRNPTGSNPGVNEVTFWAGSQRMGVYQYEDTGSGYALTKWREWGTIGGRMVRPMDRLGSDLSAGRKYLPYGQEFGAVAPVATNSGYGSNTVRDGYRWGTYWRDEGGLDYAMQRFYAPGSGRFISADPSQPGDPNIPQSWNYYGYTQGDPINFNDPTGLNLAHLVPADGGGGGGWDLPWWWWLWPFSGYSNSFVSTRTVSIVIVQT